MKLRHRPIEKEIKPLVEILNEVPYIETYSSCRGHYRSGNPQKQRATVHFKVEAEHEKDFEDLAAFVLAQTAPTWHQALVQIFKEFYVMPDETDLKTHYLIAIKPFKDVRSSGAKRKYTNRAIRKATEATRQYLDQNANR